jgi:hypothetical protein
MGARLRSEKVDPMPTVTAPEPVVEMIRDAVTNPPRDGIINRTWNG